MKFPTGLVPIGARVRQRGAAAHIAQVRAN